MPNAKDFSVFYGHNYRVLNVEGFGRIVFGCPPGLVKEFTRKKETLPSRYVIPIRTFVRGKNYFDFEFIVYNFLFIKSRKERIAIYCTADQKRRFKVILNEALFGPRFDQILRSQFHSLADKKRFTEKDSASFDAFLEKVSADKDLFSFFQSLLREHATDKKLQLEIRKYFSDLLAGDRRWSKKNNYRFTTTLARNYILCAQLKNEMDLFALAGEEDRERFTDRIIDFKVFDKKFSVTIQSDGDKRKKIEVVQVRPSVFEVRSRDKARCFLDISKPDPQPQTGKIDPIVRPFMGATFMGVGSGFAPKRRNSCVIVWMEGKGIMVDALPETNALSMSCGIGEKDVQYVFLTHVHSDHDAGLIEKILYGQRVKIISTRNIFDSFLRKVGAITCLPLSMIESFVDFLEVEPGKKVKLPGFKHSYFTFDYSLHSIPAGRFVLTYNDGKGVKRTISHSGDTKYDVEKIDAWYKKGIFAKSRRDAVLGFIWDADMIIHDVGGGALHTELSSFSGLSDSIARKMILVHQHKDPVPNTRYRFAAEGQTEALMKAKRADDAQRLETIKDIPLFKDVDGSRLMGMLTHSEIVKYRPREVVFSQNDLGDAFYVILDGFAEIIIDGKPVMIYEKGKFFGELAITTDNPHRRATIRAKTPLTVLKVEKNYYKKLNLPQIQDDFYRLRNYFNDIISPSLIASLAFGKIVHWQKDQTIIKKGASDTEMYIILSGQVEVVNEKGKTLAFLSSGDVVGEVACVKNVPRTATVVARSGAYAVCLEKKEADTVFKLFPSYYGTVYQKIKKLEATMF